MSFQIDTGFRDFHTLGFKQLLLQELLLHLLNLDGLHPSPVGGELSRSFDTGEANAAAAAVREQRLGALYAINTLGGALGALLAAYLILPLLGVDGSSK